MEIDRITFRPNRKAAKVRRLLGRRLLGRGLLGKGIGHEQIEH